MIAHHTFIPIVSVTTNNGVVVHVDIDWMSSYSESINDANWQVLPETCDDVLVAIQLIDDALTDGTLDVVNSTIRGLCPKWAPPVAS